MKNKQHEYIFKAFLSSKIPAAVHEHAPNLIAVDSAIGGYCTQLLRHEKKFNCPTDSIISKEERDAFAKLINHSSGMEKDEVVIYYRLAVLAEAVVLQYCALC